jgi:hypothetical protein
LPIFGGGDDDEDYDNDNLQVYDESEFGSNPIIAACARGHLPAVVFLLSSGGAPNQVDLEKRTALHHAGVLRALRLRCKPRQLVRACAFVLVTEPNFSYWEALRRGTGVHQSPSSAPLPPPPTLPPGATVLRRARE